MGRIHNNMYLEGFFKAFCFEKDALKVSKFENKRESFFLPIPSKIIRPINLNSRLITFIVGDVKYSIFALKQKSPKVLIIKVLL